MTDRSVVSGIPLAPGWEELPYADAKDRALDAFHAAYLGALLRRTRGNISQAARCAGMDRSNFRRVLNRYGNPLAPRPQQHPSDPPPKPTVDATDAAASGGIATASQVQQLLHDDPDQVLRALAPLQPVGVDLSPDEKGLVVRVASVEEAQRLPALIVVSQGKGLLRVLCFAEVVAPGKRFGTPETPPA